MKPPIEHLPDKKLLTILNYMTVSNDSETAIQGHLLLDSHLNQLLNIALCGGEVILRRLASGPTKRRDLAYCVGLIDEKIYQDLKSISQIRNIFAHDYPRPTFENTSINGCIGKFSHFSEFKRQGNDARTIFIKTVYVIASRLNVKLGAVIKVKAGNNA